MKPTISVYQSNEESDVTYLYVVDTLSRRDAWHGLNDGVSTVMDGCPGPGVLDLTPLEAYSFCRGTTPSKLLPTTLFAINVAERTALDAEIEIHERKAHGIAPLFGAPRRTLNEVSQLPYPLAVPLTRKFSETNIVVGAQLTSNVSDEVAVVLEVGTLRAVIVRPEDPVPHHLRVRPESSRKFTHHPSCELFGNQWVRATPALAPLPQGNCEPLLPGTVTDRGLVISLTAETIVIESPSTHTYTYQVYYNPLVSPRMFVGCQDPITVITPGDPITMLVGELWESHTGTYIMARTNGRATYFDAASLRDFWGGDSVHSSSMRDGYVHRDGTTYPCALSANQLPKRRLSHPGHWAIVSREVGEGADIEFYGCYHARETWNDMPVAVEEFYDPSDPSPDGSQLSRPHAAILASRFTCGLCGDPDQDAAHDAAVTMYTGTTRRLTRLRIGTCCVDAGRVIRCPECRNMFHVTGETRTRNQNYCPSCTTSDIIAPYHTYAYKPAPKFFGTGPLFFGVELELATSSKEHMKNMANAVAESPSGDLVYAKTDSSIGEFGLEFVTHPFSLEHLQATPVILGALMDEVSTNVNWKAMTSCGIHIHTSKAGYAVLRSSIPGDGADKLTEAQLLTRGIFRAQKFVYGNPKLITHFAGRDSSRYASLAITPGKDNYDNRTTGVQEALRLCRDHGSSKSLRYSAMNFTSTTVEYRVFRSTTDYNELLRNILFIDSIVQYSRHHAMPKTKAPDLAPYRKFLETQDYYAPVLAHFDAWTGSKKAKPSTMLDDWVRTAITLRAATPIQDTPPIRPSRSPWDFHTMAQSMTPGQVRYLTPAEQLMQYPSTNRAPPIPAPRQDDSEDVRTYLAAVAHTFQ